MSDYQPLYAEKRCNFCGYWRGQHIGVSARNDEMVCPIPVPQYPVVPTLQTFQPIGDSNARS